jgi:3-hydroxybutyryl-CoA dehydrogenase
MEGAAMSREWNRIGVVGLGTMGAGIAEVVARAGFEVVGVDVGGVELDRARAHLEQSTARGVAGAKLTEADRRSVLDRIRYTSDLTELADSDLVIEAIPEQLERKCALLRELDGLCRPDTIFATNTSALSVTEIAVATRRPGKVVGLHFFNPAPVMSLVEVVHTVVTEPEVIDDIETFVQKIDKNDVTIGDRAGFIANALLFGYLNHAAAMLETRYATREDIDAAMRMGCGLPMGPLALLDLIGLDTAYEILETMYHQSRDRLHAPTPLLKQMVTAGLLGRKSGRGFYTYESTDSPVIVDRVPGPAAADLGACAAVGRVGVVGSGTMATGIVEVLAKAGLVVHYVARTDERAAAVDAAIKASLAKAVTRGKLSEADRDATLTRITGSARLADLAAADLVIEAVIEDLDVKRALFADLDTICAPATILATTTSSLPVIECASATGRADSVIGMHFFNPAPVMKLVEVVSTVATSPRTEATVLELTQRIGKYGVRCADRAGFIVNALLFPYLNDAVKMLEAHYPMGPFELLDVVGNDVSLAIERTLYLEFREPGFAPAPLLEHLVTAGRLGRKSGKGFRDYT